MNAIILNSNNIIENIILVESLDDFPGCMPYINGAHIGDIIVNEVLIKVPPKVIVPESITPLQAELQLLAIGKLDEVLELVKLDREAFIYWNRANNFLRQDPILLKMAKAIDMSDEQLDTLFIEASTI